MTNNHCNPCLEWQDRWVRYVSVLVLAQVRTQESLRPQLLLTQTTGPSRSVGSTQTGSSSSLVSHLLQDFHPEDELGMPGIGTSCEVLHHLYHDPSQMFRKKCWGDPSLALLRCNWKHSLFHREIMQECIKGTVEFISTWYTTSS